MPYYRHSVTVHMVRTTGEEYLRVRFFGAANDVAARVNAKRYGLRVNRRGGVVRVEVLTRGYIQRHRFVSVRPVRTGVQYREDGFKRKAHASHK